VAAQMLSLVTSHTLSPSSPCSPDSVVFHPSGRYIISASDDKSIRVMDIKEERCARTIADAHGHFITSLALATTAAAVPVLVSGSVDKAIAVWPCQ